MKLIPYYGSKERIYPIMKDRIPKDSFYIEPFAGGFSLGLTLLENGIITKGVLNDLDFDVYNFWLHVKEQAFYLVTEIDKYIFEVYDNTVSVDKRIELLGTHNTLIERAAKYYIKTRVSRGFGLDRYKANLCSDLGVTLDIMSYVKFTDKLYKASKLLSDFTITNRSYEELKEFDTSDSFWYLDPPYEGHQNERFYTQHKFETDLFYVFLSELSSSFIVSNFSVPRVIELSNYWRLKHHELLVPSKTALRGYSEEVLITNMDIHIDSDSLMYSATKETV